MACTEKSLLVVNTDSAFSMSTFSSSTYFLGVLEARSSHGKPSLWCSIPELLILCKACPPCSLWKSAPSSHTALHPKHAVMACNSPCSSQRPPSWSSSSWEIPRDRKKAENKSFQHSLKLHHFQQVCSGFDLLISRPLMWEAEMQVFPHNLLIKRKEKENTIWQWRTKHCTEKLANIGYKNHKYQICL